MECVHLETCASLSLAELAELVKKSKTKNALKCKGESFAHTDFDRGDSAPENATFR